MKAIEITEFGGPEVLALAERPEPVPSSGEVLVKVSASGVNRPDVFQRKGAYAPPPNYYNGGYDGRYGYNGYNRYNGYNGDYRAPPPPPPPDRGYYNRGYDEDDGD